MAILSKLKALVGLDGGDRSTGGTAVDVEREPATESERAVKKSSPESTDGSDSTTADADEPDDADEPVDTISGIGPAYAERLAEAGVETVGDLASADAASLADETGLGEGRVTDWIERARSG